MDICPSTRVLRRRMPPDCWSWLVAERSRGSMAVTGFVEFAGTNYVRGWAYDSDAPMSRLEVAVRIGDEFYASAIADISRSDLLAAGIGDGCHGFDIDVSEAKFSAAELAALEIHAISGVDVVRI